MPQLAEQKTAKTQPYPIGDALVPLCPEGIPAGFPSGCVFTPCYKERIAAIAPGTNGGVAWAPMSYSPQTKLLDVCRESAHVEGRSEVKLRHGPRGPCLTGDCSD